MAGPRGPWATEACLSRWTLASEVMTWSFRNHQEPDVLIAQEGVRSSTISHSKTSMHSRTSWALGADDLTLPERYLRGCTLVSLDASHPHTPD